MISPQNITIIVRRFPIVSKNMTSIPHLGSFAVHLENWTIVNKCVSLALAAFICLDVTGELSKKKCSIKSTSSGRECDTSGSVSSGN